MVKEALRKAFFGIFIVRHLSRGRWNCDIDVQSHFDIILCLKASEYIFAFLGNIVAEMWALMSVFSKNFNRKLWSTVGKNSSTFPLYAVDSPAYRYRLSLSLVCST